MCEIECVFIKHVCLPENEWKTICIYIWYDFFAQSLTIGRWCSSSRTDSKLFQTTNNYGGNNSRWTLTSHPRVSLINPFQGTTRLVTLGCGKNWILIRWIYEYWSLIICTQGSALVDKDGELSKYWYRVPLFFWRSSLVKNLNSGLATLVMSLVIYFTVFSNVHCSGWAKVLDVLEWTIPNYLRRVVGVRSHYCVRVRGFFWGADFSHSYRPTWANIKYYVLLLGASGALSPSTLHGRRGSWAYDTAWTSRLQDVLLTACAGLWNLTMSVVFLTSSKFFVQPPK